LLTGCFDGNSSQAWAVQQECTFALTSGHCTHILCSKDAQQRCCTLDRLCVTVHTNNSKYLYNEGRAKLVARSGCMLSQAYPWPKSWTPTSWHLHFGRGDVRHVCHIEGLSRSQSFGHDYVEDLSTGSAHRQRLSRRNIARHSHRHCH